MSVEANEAGTALREIFDFHDDLLSIVDIGSNAIEGAPPYRRMVEAGLAHVTGFEPQFDTIKNVPGETHLPYAIGNGKSVMFRTCVNSGWSSTLKPDASTLAVFQRFIPLAEVVGEEKMKTRRLDDVAEIERIDMLKIDIQGGEMAVFKHGGTKLSDAVFIHTEVAFIPLYEGQPVLGDIDLALRRLGFVPHATYNLKRVMIQPFQIGADQRNMLNQLLDGDMVYVRDFRELGRLEPKQVKAMGLIAHLCYQSWDLGYFCLQNLVDRGLLPPECRGRYLELVNRVMAATS